MPPEKVEAIIKLSENLFKEEIDTYAGTTKRRWEEDIKTLYGVEKPDPKMPAHEFLKWATTEKEKTLQAKIEEAAKAANPELETQYKRKIENLENELKEAGLKGSELLRKDIEDYKQRLKDLEHEREAVKKDLQNERKTWEGKYMEAKRENLHLEVGFEKAQALVGVEFKVGLDAADIEDIVETRWNRILSEFTPERTVDANGKMVTVWRDKESNIARNPNNNREPYTTKELLMERLAPSLRVGRVQGGGGTNGKGGAAPTNLHELQSARTQVEADEIITRYLISQSLVKGTKSFAEKFSEIRKENDSLFNGSARLPLQ